MATSSTTLLSSLIPATTPSINSPKNQFFLLQNRSLNRPKRVSLVVRAVKPPAGVKNSSFTSYVMIFLLALFICCYFFLTLFMLLVIMNMFVWLFQVEFPKVQPQFKPPFLGFTRTAEIWNSRACMIGIIGVFVVEFVSIILCVHF